MSAVVLPMIILHRCEILADFPLRSFLGKIGGREVSQLMLGSANYSVDDYPVAVIDRIEVIRGPGASIWGTNAVNGVLNLGHQALC